jgi:hypothetical protein
MDDGMEATGAVDCGPTGVLPPAIVITSTRHRLGAHLHDRIRGRSDRHPNHLPNGRRLSWHA